MSGVEYVPDPHRSLYAQRDDARDIAVALEQENAALTEFVRDLADHGIRFDLTPTMNCADVHTLYADFALYVERINNTIQCRAEQALNGERS